MANEFRFQNSINLSLGLIAAASALMAGVLTAFFSMADKMPRTVSGAVLLVTCILAVVLCTVSVVFGGRGISATLRAAQAQRPVDRYDMGNFNRQAVFGGLGVLAIVGMLGLSLAIRAEHGAESPKAGESAQKLSAEVADRLAGLDSRIAELAQRIDRLAVQQDAVAKDVDALKSPPAQNAAHKRVGARSP